MLMTSEAPPTMLTSSTSGRILARNNPLIHAAIALVCTLLCGVVLSACDSVTAPKKGIRFKNDSLDRSYNRVKIEEVVTPSGWKSFSATIKPGESVIIPYDRITRLRISRRYKNYTRVYVVECPSLESGINMKLLDVHVNRIAGGCNTIEAYKR